MGGEHLQRVHHLPLQVREGQAGPVLPLVVLDEHRLFTLEEASETMVDYSLPSLKVCAGISRLVEAAKEDPISSRDQFPNNTSS